LGTAYPQNKFPRSVSRFYTQSGEILDAFVFGRINFDESPLSLKAGKHALNWGESLFSPIHGVSYAQAPLDLRKGVANAGIEVKELFLPTNQFSAHLQVNPKLCHINKWQTSQAQQVGQRIRVAGILTSAVSDSHFFPRHTGIFERFAYCRCTLF
jgi:hypothetical protein